MDGTKLEDAAAVKAGDVLRFYADGSTVTADYTVVQKNAWNSGSTTSRPTLRARSGRRSVRCPANGRRLPISVPMCTRRNAPTTSTTASVWTITTRAFQADRSAIHGLIAWTIPGDSAGDGDRLDRAEGPVPVKVTLDKVTGAHVEPYHPVSRTATARMWSWSCEKNDEVISSATMTDTLRRRRPRSTNASPSSAKGTVKVAVGDVLRFSVGMPQPAPPSRRYPPSARSSPTPGRPMSLRPEPGLSERYCCGVSRCRLRRSSAKKATASGVVHEGRRRRGCPGAHDVRGRGCDMGSRSRRGAVRCRSRRRSAQAGKTVTATVTVTSSDKSTDTATVTFEVAAKTEAFARAWPVGAVCCRRIRLRLRRRRSARRPPPRGVVHEGRRRRGCPGGHDVRGRG